MFSAWLTAFSLLHAAPVHGAAPARRTARPRPSAPKLPRHRMSFSPVTSLRVLWGGDLSNPQAPKPGLPVAYAKGTWGVSGSPWVLASAKASGGSSLKLLSAPETFRASSASRLQVSLRKQLGRFNLLEVANARRFLQRMAGIKDPRRAMT